MINKLVIIFLLLTTSFCISKDTKWRKVFQADNANFIGIDNPDSNYCMAIATNVTYKEIVKSTDGGETWFHVFKDTTDLGKWKAYGKDISYPSRDFCIIGLDSNAFLKTTDGGLTWNEYIIDLPYWLFGFYDIDMYDENNGVMASQRYLAVSHDGFQTWDTYPSPSGDYIFAVAMASPNSICVLCRDSKVSDSNYVRFYRSDNGGKKWDEYPISDYCIPVELKFIDSLNGFEVGYRSTGIGQQDYELIFRTTDGGRTWEKVLDTVIGCSFGLQKLDFFDEDNGIAVGQCGAVFWTHDGGNSWKQDWDSVVMENTPATMNVCYIRKNKAIIADFWGRILISEDTTTDVIDEFPSDDDFVLYPNPAADKIKIRLEVEFINSTQIQIFNSYGQEIKQQHSSFNFQLYELDVSSLLSGVYFALIISNGNIRKKSFVVMR